MAHVTDDQRRQVAQRLRDLADRAAVEDLTSEGWDELDARLAAASDLFPEEHEARTRFARGFIEAARHPIAEGTSGVYPPIEFVWEDDLLVAHVHFGPAWEGPPDLVHGGYLAAGFDMVISSMAHRILGHSVTRRLQVRYLKPTFFASALRYEVEADEPKGRLLDLRARLYADDQVTMRASAQFASVDTERFADRRRS